MGRERTSLSPLGSPLITAGLDYSSELASTAFISCVMERGLGHVVHDYFRGTVPADGVAELGRPVIVRMGVGGQSLEAILELGDGVLALVDLSVGGQVAIEVAAEEREPAVAGASRLRGALHVEAAESELVPMVFWTAGRCGDGSLRHRSIEAPALAEIAGNYPPAVIEQLVALSDVEPPPAGRVILWRGEPGTGKSYALRALTRGWRDWCSAHYVLDPDALLGRDGEYLLGLLAWRDDEDAEEKPDRWRLLVLEDAGELVRGTGDSSRAIAALLNLTDGILGQGTRTIVLITTNEPTPALHPALRRPGRCLADLEFARFSVDEGNQWLDENGSERRVEAAHTLAELFQVSSGNPMARSAAFGFARDLFTA